MKTFLKVTAAVLVLGLVLTCAGWAMGGELYSNWRNGRLYTWDESHSVGFSRWRFAREVGDDIRDAADDVRDEILDQTDVLRPHRSHRTEENTAEHVSPNSALNSIDVTGTVDSLELELSAGKYTIQTGASFSLTGSGLDAVDSWYDGGVWHIESHNRRGDGEVVITLPADTVFDAVDLEIGAGEVALCPITAREIDISVGAGALTADRLDADAVSLEVGAGSVTAGLAEGWDKYSYDSEAALGEVRVDDTVLQSGLAGSVSGGRGARTLDIEVGAGAVNLTTGA